MIDKALKERLLGALYNQVPMSVAIVDKKYNIVDANKNFEEKFGEWQGKKCYAVYKGRKRKCTKCMASITFEDGLCHVDDELGTDRHGRLTRYVLNTAPIKGENDTVDYVIEMVKDVTEEKNFERDYQVLFQRVPNYVAVMDRNFRIVRANEKFRETYGDCIGEKCYKVYKKRNVKCDNCPAERTFKDGKAHQLEQKGFTKEGERNYYVMTTAPLGRKGEKFAYVMEIATDVTEVRKLQDELTLLYNFQEKLIRTSTDAIIATDEKNRVVIFNPAAEQLFGFSSESVIGSTRLKRYLPKEFLDTIIKNGDTCFLPETGVKQKSSSTVPVRFSGVVLKDDDIVVGSAAFLHDLTEIKKLENAKLESERMAAVGQTVAGLAHGVKNILTGIEGGMYILNSGLENSDVERIYSGFKMLDRNIEKITVFTRDFLSFSKGEKPLAKLINPAKIAKDVYQLYKDSANQVGVKLVAEIESIEKAFFDPDGLHACLANLLSNAIDACLVSEKKARTVKLSAFESNDAIMFEVKDNGVGMDYEVKKKVFTNFFTTKGTKGTGIGLLTTRKIVVQHGGDITVDSRPGKGTVFRITFNRSKLPLMV
ncbi:PAS domain S-box protein [candidate division KSB1 bacterium]